MAVKDKQAYKQFKEELENVKARKQKTDQDLKDKDNIIADLKQKHDMAVIEGNQKEVKRLSEEINNALESKEELLRQAQVLENTDLKSMINKSDKLKELGDKVIAENSELLQEKQEQVNTKVQELEDIKKAFYEKVAELGELYREGKTLAGQLQEVERTLYDSNKIRSIKLNFSDIQKDGPMFIDNVKAEKLFKDVGVQYKVK